MTLYCGIDLHSTNSFVAVTDEQDRPVFEKRLPNELERIVVALAPYRGEMSGVVVESTYNWYWLVDGLMDAGFELHLANTGAIKQYEGLKHGDDPSGRAVSCSSAAPGDTAAGLYLSTRGARLAGPAAQALANGSPGGDPPAEPSGADHPAHRAAPQRE